MFSLTHSHHERREVENKGLRKWNLIFLIFQGNQSTPEKNLPMKKDTHYYLFVYWLFVRIMSFKILLFPIIDSLWNPLKNFICGIRACMKFMILLKYLISPNCAWTLIMKFRDYLISLNYVWTLIMKFRDDLIFLNYV